MAFLNDFAEWLKTLLSPEYAPYWIVILSVIALVESSIFPTQLLFMMPPDVPLMIFALAKPEWAILLSLICTIASVLGGCLGYLIGRRGGRPLLSRFLREEKMAAVDRLYAKYGVAAVGIAGLTPLPYIAFTLSAGAFRLDFRPFVLISLLSRGMRFFAEGILCWLWGDKFKTFFRQYFDWVTVGVAAVVVVLAVAVRLFLRRRGRAKRTAQGAG